MNREFTLIIERDAHGFYVASVPTLRGSWRARPPSQLRCCGGLLA
jgi:hypothetical protein